MAEQLTRDQLAAVTARGGRLLISAAAGSGKTKVLVDRLLGFITDPVNPANIDDFLIITYTKAAASELRGKISAKLSQAAAQNPQNRHLARQLQRIYLAKISTVHSYCADILREYGYLLDIPSDFKVADELQAQALREEAMEEVLEKAYETLDPDGDIAAFVDSLGLGRNDRQIPAIVASVYDSLRCHPDPMAWERRFRDQALLDGVTDPGETLWGAYLMDSFRQTLEVFRQELTEAAALCAQFEDLTKKYAPAIEDDLEKVEALLAAASWDQLHAAAVPAFARLGVLRKPESPETAEQVKKARDRFKTGLKKAQAIFLQDGETVLANQEQANRAALGALDLASAFEEAFTKRKRRAKLLDFSDLEHAMLALLLGKTHTGPTAASREIARRYREVLVDEYQDTNAVQDLIFTTLTNEKENLFMVGDVKQSIYRFRLADPGIFLEKYRKFNTYKEQTPGDRKILLSQNFRSGSEVLQAANDVFSLSMAPEVGGLYYGPQEALREGIPHTPIKDAVELHCIHLDQEGTREEAAPSKYEVEAQFVAQRIAEMLVSGTTVREGDGLRPCRVEDFAILLRAPGTAGSYYQNALEKRGIPCVFGGGGDVLTSMEVSVLRSILQVIDNPRQDIPLTAALMSPAFGFTADRLGQIRAGNIRDNLYDALLESKEAPDVAAFLKQLEEFQLWARLDTLTVLLEKILDATRLDRVCAAMEDGGQRQERLRLFFQTAAGFEEKGRKDLPQFLDYLTHLEARGLVTETAGGQGVMIQSIHKSKGLEYPIVFLCNLSAGFNLRDAREPLLIHPELGLGCAAVDRKLRLRYPTMASRAICQKMQEESVSEELRVLYVAMTRAKDRLVMTYASKYLQRELAAIGSALRPPLDVLTSRQADCLGHWVLMAALCRTESGALKNFAQIQTESSVSNLPWVIRLHTGSQVMIQPPLTLAAAGEPEARDWAQVVARLGFSYPHSEAVAAPSKRTATQLKGRYLDEEAAAHTVTPRPRGGWRQPAFLSEAKPDGRTIGTANHLALQFIRYERCGSVNGVRAEVTRLADEEFLTPQQAALVDCEKITAFFTTDLGRKLMKSPHVLREFKFSVFEDGSVLSPALAGEQVMLQGVVDCCLDEPGGLTILDFKTDAVTPSTIDATAQRYAPQVRAYSQALSRILGKSVLRQLLYFFRLGRLIEIERED